MEASLRVCREQKDSGRRGENREKGEEECKQRKAEEKEKTNQIYRINITAVRSKLINVRKAALYLIIACYKLL